MKKIKIGFFGGCFNPPSNMHINLAKELVIDRILDQVVFVPVGDYYKKDNLIKADYRYNMLLLACKKYEYLRVEDLAVKSKKTLYATDTFKLIYDKYNTPDTDIYLIMGSDNFIKMADWKNYDEIINKYNYIVIERPNYREKVEANNIIYYELKQKEDISSTKIRNLLKRNKDITPYLDKEVVKYIEENNLYR